MRQEPHRLRGHDRPPRTGRHGAYARSGARRRAHRQHLLVHRHGEAGIHRRHFRRGERARREPGTRQAEDHRRRLPLAAFREGSPRHHAGSGRLHRPRPDHQGRADHREPVRKEELRRSPENRRPRSDE